MLDATCTRNLLEYKAVQFNATRYRQRSPQIFSFPYEIILGTLTIWFEQEGEVFEGILHFNISYSRADTLASL